MTTVNLILSFINSLQFVLKKKFCVFIHEAAGPLNTTWNSRTSKEDMEDMWIHPNVNKEWMKSGENKGKVRFSHDTEKRPYLSHVELRVRYCLYNTYLMTDY